ncbi:hypothetical protein B0H13DRAFT_1854802 [Mycena leptocephala]|nr:hypothetical protein B0H13DRAFT_1854802 [Mycena leptocephala]
MYTLICVKKTNGMARKMWTKCRISENFLVIWGNCPGSIFLFPELYQSIGNESKYRKAPAVNQEAVKLRRRLCDCFSASSQFGLACSLNTHSCRLSLLDENTEALKVSEEAVDHRRRLTQSDPATFQESLAGALDTVSNIFCRVGRYKDGLAVITEAQEMISGMKPSVSKRYTSALFLCSRSNCLFGLREPSGCHKEEISLHGADAASRLTQFCEQLKNLLLEIEQGLGKLQNPEKKGFRTRFKEFGRSTSVGDELKKYKSRVHQLQQNFITSSVAQLRIHGTFVSSLVRLLKCIGYSTRICNSASTSSLDTSLSSAHTDIPWTKRHFYGNVDELLMIRVMPWPAVCWGPRKPL